MTRYDECFVVRGGGGKNHRLVVDQACDIACDLRRQSKVFSMFSDILSAATSSH